jgi:hypothetical protein
MQTFSMIIYGRELSNDMLHAAYTRRNRVDSRLLVFESQTTSLTLDRSLDLHLCFKCQNGQCKPILDIYVSIAF